MWGSVQSHGHFRDGVVLSDDADQFNIGRHALCLVHAERLVYCATIWMRKSDNQGENL